MAAFTAAGTSYATHGEPMVPIYVFYSMFGFQRTGDSIWAAADQMTRGFLIGATAGRTTLTGEGLQHADGHSPAARRDQPGGRVTTTRPTRYEIAHIMQDGLRRMYGDRPRERHLLPHGLQRADRPAEASPRTSTVEGILRGMYLLRRGSTEGLGDDAPRVQLLASGVGVPWALEAQELLRDDWGVVADVWSVTSWNELRRDGLAADEQAFLHPEQEPPGAVRDPAAAGRPGPGRGGVGLHAPGPGPDRASGCPATSPRSAPTASASPTPGRRRGASSTSTAPRSRCGRCRCWPSAARSTPSVAREAAERYRLLDVTAGTSGNAGGES